MAGEPNFADITRITTTFINATYKIPVKVKRITNFVFYIYFSIKQKLLMSTEKCLCQ